MFRKTVFLELSLVSQKFAVIKSVRKVAYDWSIRLGVRSLQGPTNSTSSTVGIITGPDSGVVRRFPTVQASSNRWQVAVNIISFAREARVDLRSRACEAKPLSGKRGSRAV